MFTLAVWGFLFLLYYQYMEKFRYLQKTKLNNLPKAPGVYALSSLKTILYIGKATNIKERVRNHFTQTNYKDNLFMQNVTRVGYIKTNSDIDALLLESQLIKKQQPKYNVMWKDDKQYFYVAITPSTTLRTSKEQLPHIFLTHQPVELPKGAGARAKLGRGRGYGARSEGGSSQRPKPVEYIGPFVEGKAIKRVLQLLRRVFPYYTQPQRRGAGYTTKKHGVLLCQYCHLNLCPGPTPNAKTYKKNIHNLISVLKGKKTSVLKQLEKEMKNAAKNQNFEKAGILRDQFLSLERIVSHARLLSPEISISSGWITIEKELQKLLGTKKRTLRIEAYDISNIQGQQATGSQVTFVKGVPTKDSYRKYKIHITGKPNDFAMMQELITRRLQHSEWPYPQLMVIDGGKGQLTSTLKAISSLTKSNYPRPTSPGRSPGGRAQLSQDKLQKIKVVALAKKQNELFFPKRKNSILLRDLPRPVENLFLHIRDEAHRFAISYHRTLRSKALLK